MPAPIKISISDTLQGMRVAFEDFRPLIIRVTIVFAVLNALAAALDVAGAAGLAISFGITILLRVAYGGMITAIICLPGRSKDAAETWAAVKPVLARLVWVTLATAGLVLAGLVAFILPGLIVATLLAVASQSVVAERTTVFQSLGRSFELVKDNAWRVFLFLVIIGLASLLMVALALLASVPLGAGTAGAMVTAFLSNLLSAPIVAIGPAALFNELTGRGVNPQPAMPPAE